MFKNIKKIVIIIVSAFIYSIGYNFFLVPANVYGGGFSGISQLLMTIIYNFFGIHISMGIFLLLLNIPVFIIGWRKVGKQFTLYSLLSVACMSAFLQIVPIQRLSDDILLNAVFGGTITAIGVGLTLRFGASTGGLDIIAVLLSRWKDQPIGKYNLLLNSIIIFTAGYLYGWEKALYTMVNLYASSRMIDTVHTRFQKLTAMIITKSTDKMKNEIIDKLGRGVTIIPARGAFSDESKEMLLTVITKYELYALKEIVQSVDPEAFTDIIHTESVYGRFRKEQYD